MRHRGIAAAIALTLAAGLAVAASAAPAGKTRGISLLNGRLIARFPSAARVLPPTVQRNVTVTWSIEDETRVVVQSGDERLVAVCDELLDKAGRGFAADVRAFIEEHDDLDTATIKRAALRDARLEAYRVVPSAPIVYDGDDSAIFVESLFVRNTDGMVQKLAFRVNAAAEKKLAAYRPIIRAIEASVVAGSRKLDCSRRTVDLDKGRPTALTLRLPDGYAMTVERGRDFSIYRVFPIGRLGTESGALGIDIGTRRAAPTGGEQTVAGTLLGKPVMWRRYSGKGPTAGKYFRDEALVDHPTAARVRVAVFVVGPTAQRRDAMRAIAETLAAP